MFILFVTLYNIESMASIYKTDFHFSTLTRIYVFVVHNVEELRRRGGGGYLAHGPLCPKCPFWCPKCSFKQQTVRKPPGKGIRGRSNCEHARRTHLFMGGMRTWMPERDRKVSITRRPKGLCTALELMTCFSRPARILIGHECLSRVPLCLFLKGHFGH